MQIFMPDKIIEEKKACLWVLSLRVHYCETERLKTEEVQSVNALAFFSFRSFNKWVFKHFETIYYSPE